MMFVRVVVVAIVLMATGRVAVAQPAEPIGPFVADVRLTIPRFKALPTVATDLGVQATNMPTRGLGLALGAHWLPIRMGVVTLGVGGELLVARGSKTLEPTTEGGPEGPTVNTRLSSITPQISFNFGKRNGWSYITGGLGRAALTSELETSPLEDATTNPRVINYGGGARWFVNDHVAVTLDLRFYAISLQEAEPGRPAYPRSRITVFSGGISFK